MKKFVDKLICIVLAAVMAAGILQLAACSSAAAYSVSYDLNYDGGEVRTVSVVTGAHAVDWQPYREGWTLEGWYTDENCTQAFDFDRQIDGDVTLYAYWTKEPDMHRVIFDSNYAGGDVTAKDIADGKKITADDVPSVSRLGFTLDGWYKDKECTDPWAFGYDAVTESMTLYAGYSYDESIPRTAGGTPIFEDVEIYVWNGAGFYTNETTQTLVKQFNEIYEGKIHVTFSTEFVSQDALSLRLQQTPGMISTYKNYYCLSDVFDLAGISYDSDIWYEKASQDSYVDGKIYSMPLLASTPFIIYNKSLMERYNGTDPLPDSYTSFSALLSEVYKGEKSDPSFETIVSNRGWTFNEIPSSAVFVQNGAPYYEYRNGVYQNEWSAEENFNNAVTGLENMYALLGQNGSLHGRLNDDMPNQNGNDMWGSKFTIEAVKSGKAFMGLVNWSYALNDINGESELGVMPLSGLYADGEDKDLIPVHTMGFAFYRAAGISNTELAASAVFADYISKNSWRYGAVGYYPVRKSAAESDEFLNRSDGCLTILKSTGDPNNFMTLYGHKNGKKICSTGASEYINPYLDGESADTAESVIEKLMNFSVGWVTV